MIVRTRSADGLWLDAPGRKPLPSVTFRPGFHLGVTEPTWANTGHTTPDVNLVDVPGPELQTTSAGQVIEGRKFINSRLRVMHPNVIVRDCLFQYTFQTGRLYIQNHVGIAARAADGAFNLRVENCTFDPVNARDPNATRPADGIDQWGNDAQVSGIYMQDGVVTGCRFRHVTDSLMPDVSASNQNPAHFWGNYCENRYLPYDVEQVDGTHNDGVQIAGGFGGTIIGNTFKNMNGDATAYSAKGQSIVATPYHGEIGDWDILNNWCYGGYSQISVWPTYEQGGPCCPSMRIVGNRHGGTCVWPILFNHSSFAAAREVSGNVAHTGGLTWNSGTAAAGTTVYVNKAANTQGTGVPA